jgi:adenylate cyclase
MRSALEALTGYGERLLMAAATAGLVQALVRRAGATDLAEAQAAIERVAAAPTEPGFVMNELWLLAMWAWEARARGDEPAYRDYRDRYHSMANSLGFEGHIALAQAMD